MTRKEKQAIVNELADKFATHQFFYITDAAGLSVASINRFRRLCFDKGMEYKVYKNTLIRKALDTLSANTSAMDTALKGQSGVLFSKESGSAPAKLLKAFYKAEAYGKGVEAKPAFKGAYIDSDVFVGAENLEVLNTIKSKQDLIGEIVGLLQSPAKNVISALQGGGNKLAGILKTLSEKE
ncbi:50S ribosomal protein L10 [Adhaeribacter pallidiroseus]|uniref:Large ribosomal subunit protein uL10 n=1 Tax=Adhaeribacter pallidiroseus TaxID=2072847 RepID=A0A369QJ86_9BACT|nr:50S ribosomal protein L10 [Adhaeribacter pallidiroseus]RDC64774.1 50S ribosomal protein L10 [Adhaeribacter pallidiroseus]